MRKDFGEKAERKWRFNAFDIILALLLVAALVALAIMIVHFFPEQSSTTGDTKITYIITVTDVPEAVSSQLKTGQTVFDIKTGKALGEVAAVACPLCDKGSQRGNGRAGSEYCSGQVRYQRNCDRLCKKHPCRLLCKRSADRLRHILRIQNADRLAWRLLRISENTVISLFYYK